MSLAEKSFPNRLKSKSRSVIVVNFPCWYLALPPWAPKAASDMYLSPCSRFPVPLSLLFPLLGPRSAAVRSKGRIRFVPSTVQPRSRSLIVLVSVAVAWLCGRAGKEPNPIFFSTVQPCSRSLIVILSVAGTSLCVCVGQRPNPICSFQRAAASQAV